MFKRIVVPLDGSQCAANALEVAMTLAKAEGSEIIICSVFDPMPSAGIPPAVAGAALTAAQSSAQRIVDEAVAKVTAAGIPVKGTTMLGDAAFEIVSCAKNVQADAIVIGTHGRTGLKRLFMGSVAEGVLRSASVPVVVVPKQAHIPASKVSVAS